MKFSSSRTLIAGSLALASATAHAHVGHGISSFQAGLAHPLGLDHLLATLAVGVWSVRVLPVHRMWQGPAVFLLALLGSACLGVVGVSLPHLESLISLSVVMFGLMLMYAHRQGRPGSGLVLIATAAILHGLAHGSEARGTPFASYASGFLLTTAALHASGMALAIAVQQGLTRHQARMTRISGLLCGAAGFYFWSQV